MEMKGTQRQSTWQALAVGRRRPICEGSRSMLFWYFCFFLFLPPSLLVNTPVSSQHHKTLGISWCFVAFPLALLAFLGLCCQAGHPNADLLGIEWRGPIQPGNGISRIHEGRNPLQNALGRQCCCLRGS